MEKDFNIDDTTFAALSEHAPLWERIHSARQHQRMTQALLLIGPPHVGVYVFAHRLAALLLCHAESKPCGACDACLLLRAGTHPDYQIIRPEAEGGVIKIDQIRQLQDTIYQTPQCGEHVTIVFEHADKMNIASANALLKVLEEPPAHVYFILGAEQLSAIPATILSRTQRMIFPDLRSDPSHYLAMGKSYPPASNRAKLYDKRQAMIMGLCDMIEGRLSPCTVATQWNDFHVTDSLWLLYLIVAQALRMQLLPTEQVRSDHDAIARLARLLTPLVLLRHFDTMHLLLKKLSHNISINTTLALEQVFMDLIPKADDDRS